MKKVAFTVGDAQKAAEEWGANCGPGALAGVLGLTLDAVRPHLRGFEQKRYTNPTMMRAALKSLNVDYRWIPHRDRSQRLPVFGLARVQWDGPWTRIGVPPAAAYRHTHWIGSYRADGGISVFDVNCICVGGWVCFDEWSQQVVPWLLKQCETKANGDWWMTHAVEITNVCGITESA